MGLRSDQWIKYMAAHHKLLDPFVGAQIRGGKISHGLSSAGYDLRIAPNYKRLSNLATSPGANTVLDPKHVSDGTWVDFEGPECVVPANGLVLGRSVERFVMPRDTVGLCIGKSSYARCGLIVNVTPIEPGWEGYLTIELSNSTPLPIRVYSNEGICQVLFFTLDEACSVSYADRGGKYGNQPAEPVSAKL